MTGEVGGEKMLDLIIKNPTLRLHPLHVNKIHPF